MKGKRGGRNRKEGWHAPYMRSLPTPQLWLRLFCRIRSFVAGVRIYEGTADVRPAAVVWRWRQLHHVTHQLVHVHVSESIQFRATLEICAQTKSRPLPTSSAVVTPNYCIGRSVAIGVQNTINYWHPYTTRHLQYKNRNKKSFIRYGSNTCWITLLQ